MKKVVILIAALALGGCSAIYKPVSVPVPLACPAPEVPPMPKLAIYEITPDSQPDFIAKAYVATVYDLLAYKNALLEILEAYKH